MPYELVSCMRDQCAGVEGSGPKVVRVYLKVHGT